MTTGQNPCSTSGAAEAVVRAMERKLAPREPIAGECRMALSKWTRPGDVERAHKLLKEKHAQHDVPLIAGWGRYRSKKFGTDRKLIEGAIDAMEVGLPHYEEPRLMTAIAHTRAKQAKAP